MRFAADRAATRAVPALPGSRPGRGSRRLRALSAALLLAGAAGCGGIEEAERGAREDAEAVGRELGALRGEAGPGWSAIRVSKRPWLAIEPVEPVVERALPEALRGGSVTLPLGDISGDEALAARIEAAADVEVRLAGKSSGGAPLRGFAKALGDGWTPAAGIWSGPLPRLLDAWAAAGGYRWRHEAGRIVVVRRETVTFGINALAGSQRYTARTSTQDRARGEGSSGSAVQSISTTATFDPWPEIAAQIGRMVAAESDLSVSPGSAAVTVSGTPATLRRVRGYLRHLNRSVLRPVTVSAHMYSVRFEREADYQLGIVALIDGVLGSRLRLDVGAGRIAVVRPGAALPAGADTLGATLRALRSVGTASRVLSADVPSLNGKPAQFYELLKTAYLREVTSVSTDSGTRTTLRPGEISSGFSMSYTARITAPDELLVRLVASLRDRPTFAVFGTEFVQIQLPTYADRGVQATQRLRRGETLIVSGFRERGSSAAREGSLHESVPLPEGARRARGFRQEQVLLLTADIGAPLGISETRETRL